MHADPVAVGFDLRPRARCLRNRLLEEECGNFPVHFRNLPGAVETGRIVDELGKQARPPGRQGRQQRAMPAFGQVGDAFSA